MAVVKAIDRNDKVFFDWVLLNDLDFDAPDEFTISIIAAITNRDEYYLNSLLARGVVLDNPSYASPLTYALAIGASESRIKNLVKFGAPISDNDIDNILKNKRYFDIIISTGISRNNFIDAFRIEKCLNI